MPWVGMTGATLKASEIQFDVFSGYGEILKRDCWLPLSFEIFHDQEGFSGVIEMWDASGQIQRLIPVDLPRGTRKRIQVPVYHEGNSYAWKINLRDAQGNLLAERTQFQHTELGPQGFVLGSVSESFAGQPSLPKQAAFEDQSFLPRVGRIMAQSLPQDALSMEGLSALYLHASQAELLETSQWESLHAWLFQGGCLIVAAEDPAQLRQVAELSAIIPFIVEGVGNLPWGTSLSQWLTSASPKSSPLPTCYPALFDQDTASGGSANTGGSGNPNFRINLGTQSIYRDNRYLRLSHEPGNEEAFMPILTGKVTDGMVLAEQDGFPLIVHARRGLGQITFLTFNPEREPVKGWNLQPWFWAKLSGIPGAWFDMTQPRDRFAQTPDSLFGSLIESRQIQKLPIGWLMVMLAAYLIVIGPGDRWLLKKYRREMWTWITFPSYVLTFSLIIYYVGFRLRSGALEYRELQLIDWVATEEAAGVTRHRQYASIYSPRTTSYSLVGMNPNASLRPEASLMWQGSVGGKGAIITHKEGGSQAEVKIPVWTSRLFVGEGHAHDTPAPVRLVENVLSDGKLRVTLENLGALPLDEIRILYRGNYLDATDELSPSAMQQWIIDPDTAPEVSTLWAQYADQFKQAISSRSAALGETYRLEDVMQTVTGASLIQGINQHMPSHQRLRSKASMDLTPYLDQGHPILLARSSQRAILPTMNRFEPKTSRSDILLRVVLPLPGLTSNPDPEGDKTR